MDYFTETGKAALLKSRKLKSADQKSRGRDGTLAGELIQGADLDGASVQALEFSFVLQKSDRVLGHVLAEGLLGQGTLAQQPNQSCPAAIGDFPERDQQTSRLDEQRRREFLGLAAQETRSASHAVERELVQMGLQTGRQIFGVSWNSCFGRRHFGAATGTLFATSGLFHPEDKTPSGQKCTSLNPDVTTITLTPMSAPLRGLESERMLRCAANPITV